MDETVKIVEAKDKVTLSYTASAPLKFATLSKSLNATCKILTNIAKAQGIKIKVCVTDMYMLPKDGDVIYNVELCCIPLGAKLANMRYEFPSCLVDAIKERL